MEVKKLFFHLWASPVSVTVQGRFHPLLSTLWECRVSRQELSLGVAVTCSLPVSQRGLGRGCLWQIRPTTEQHPPWHFCQTNLWKHKSVSGCAVSTPPTQDHPSWSPRQLPSATGGVGSAHQQWPTLWQKPGQGTRIELEHHQGTGIELKQIDGEHWRCSCQRLAHESPWEGPTKPQSTENTTYWINNHKHYCNMQLLTLFYRGSFSCNEFRLFCNSHQYTWYDFYGFGTIHSMRLTLGKL